MDKAQLDPTADDEAWESIPGSDPLWAGPTSLPPALAHPAPALLNTHEMNWESFERLIISMARIVDGAYDVRLYGRPGQAQEGIDLVAFFHGLPCAVYQAKDRDRFGAADLEALVRKYGDGRRPFGAQRIVAVTAVEARDTATVEKLAELRTQYRGDLTIDLWDQHDISEQLRSHPQVVTTFFGPDTARAFCPVLSLSPTPPTTTGIAADAIVRGPIAHLNLTAEMRRATEARADRPDEAAAGFAAIAERLESSGFVPHAAPIRELQAEALRAADRRSEEADVRIDMGWRHLNGGDTFSSELQVREVAAWHEAPPTVVAGLNALATATGLRRFHDVTLEDMAEALDGVPADDPHAVDAAVALAEEAVAARQHDVVLQRITALRAIADRVSAEEPGGLRSARLRMCLADCSGAWDELMAKAREEFAPDVTALVLARHARHLALIPAPQASIGRWRDAIEKACLEHLNDDAADWLYAMRDVQIQAGLLEGINDHHRHAQALRAAGSGTILPEGSMARERGLSYLRGEKWPDALEALREYLWRQRCSPIFGVNPTPTSCSVIVWHRRDDSSQPFATTSLRAIARSWKRSLRGFPSEL